MIYFFEGFLHFFLSAIIVKNDQEKAGFFLDVFIKKLGISVVIKVALRKDVVPNVAPDSGRYCIIQKVLIYRHNSLKIAKV